MIVVGCCKGRRGGGGGGNLNRSLILTRRVHTTHSPSTSTTHKHYHGHPHADVSGGTLELHTLQVPRDDSFHQQYTDQHPPMLYLHGVLGSGRNWNGTASTIFKETGFPGILVDARNHGDSPHHPDMTYETMAQDINFLLLKHNLTKVNLLGHSMGGKTAMTFALKHPEYISKLIIVDISPKGSPNSEVGPTITLLKQLNLKQPREKIDADLAVKIKDPNMRGFLLQNLKSSHINTFEWRIPLSYIEESIPIILQALPPPAVPFPGKALFVGGSQSNYITESSRELILQMFPHATVVMIDKAGHMPHVENAKRFVQVVSDYLNEI